MADPIEKVIVDTLSTNFGGRVYPSYAPQNTAYPCCIYLLISSPTGYTHSGYDGLPSPRFQIEVYSKTRKEAMEKVKAVKDALHDLGRPFFCQNEHGNYYDDVRLHVVRMDWILKYKE